MHIFDFLNFYQNIKKKIIKLKKLYKKLFFQLLNNFLYYFNVTQTYISNIDYNIINII